MYLLCNGGSPEGLVVENPATQTQCRTQCRKIETGSIETKKVSCVYDLRCILYVYIVTVPETKILENSIHVSVLKKCALLIKEQV